MAYIGPDWRLHAHRDVGAIASLASPCASTYRLGSRVSVSTATLDRIRWQVSSRSPIRNPS
eukprot:scaffold80517_cov60-Phaeocystis_antarctica.AAC.2